MKNIQIKENIKTILQMLNDIMLKAEDDKIFDVIYDEISESYQIINHTLEKIAKF